MPNSLPARRPSQRIVRAIFLVTSAVLVGIGIPAHAGSLPCVEPVVRSPAACTFNIWGYVTDADGAAIEGAVVSSIDTGTATESGPTGFFDLYVEQPGSYRVNARVTFPGGFCSRSTFVWVGPEALVNGGERQDFDLDFCHRA